MCSVGLLKPAVFGAASLADVFLRVLDDDRSPESAAVPPPTTSMLSGRWRRARALVESRIRSESMSKVGITDGREPVAMMACSKVARCRSSTIP